MHIKYSEKPSVILLISNINIGTNYITFFMNFWHFWHNIVGKFFIDVYVLLIFVQIICDLYTFGAYAVMPGGWVIMKILVKLSTISSNYLDSMNNLKINKNSS